MDDEISQGPERDPRLTPNARRWLTAASLAGLVAATAVFAVTRGGGHQGSAARGPAATASGVTRAPAATTPTGSQLSISMFIGGSRPSPDVTLVIHQPPAAITGKATAPAVAAPGTTLVSCDSAIWAQLPAGWHAGSLHVGSLWLVGARQVGYARLGRARQAAGAAAGQAMESRQVELLLHVDAGSAVVMRAGPGTPPSFTFTNDLINGNALPPARGFTFIPCAPAVGKADGVAAFYNIGFTVAPGHAVSVEVWTSRSARPVWLTLTAPASVP
jgi:hypothetical protein